MVGDFGSGDVQLDGVVSLDVWVWVTNGAAIVCDQEWNVLSTHLGLLNLAQLVL